MFLMAIVVGCGGASLLGFGGRLAWLLELTSHFRVQYFWCLAAAAAGLAISRRPKWTLAACALAMLNLVLIVPLYFGPAPRVTAERTTRAMSLNVHWLNKDFGRTLELIDSERPDFVLFMEVTPQWADALRFMEPGYPYWQCFDRADSGGLALYSRVPIIDLRLEYAGDAALPTIIAELDVAGGPLTLIGTHPASPGSASNFHLRNRQLSALSEVVRGQHGALMLLGDLNTTGWSPYFHDLLGNSGLSDTRRGFGVQGSWPALPLPLRIPIDHCLVSGEVSVAERWVGPAVGSDHRAIIVDFALGAR
jgi:endonuclease/exonuclease/phosphatase (EEP) superfamily protein YafD